MLSFQYNFASVIKLTPEKYDMEIIFAATLAIAIIAVTVYCVKIARDIY